MALAILESLVFADADEVEAARLEYLRVEAAADGEILDALVIARAAALPDNSII